MTTNILKLITLILLSAVGCLEATMNHDWYSAGFCSLALALAAKWGIPNMFQRGKHMWEPRS